MNEHYPEELLAAADKLGRALNATPQVQAFIQADEAVKNSAELRKLKEEMDQVYADLVRRQQAGEMVFSHEVGQFYNLRDRLVTHPLMVERENCLNAVRALFDQAGTTMSSILSVNFSELASD